MEEYCRFRKVSLSKLEVTLGGNSAKFVIVISILTSKVDLHKAYVFEIQEKYSSDILYL